MEEPSRAARPVFRSNRSREGRRPQRKLQWAPDHQDRSGLEQRIVDDLRPYRIAYEIIKQQIINSRLPQGLVLLESRMAELLGMSRAPIRRALELLHKDGLIRRFDGRGYLVGAGEDGGGAKSIAPLRLDPLDAGFRAPDGLSESIGLFTWERIYLEIAGAVGRTIPFGTYRILESVITERFSVSRTVAREVLGRLRDRGLIEKNRWSTWIAGPLTARTVDECFDIRILLEPHALRTVSAVRDRVAIESLRTRLSEAISQPALRRTEIERLEGEIDDLLWKTSWNQRLLAIIEECRMPMVINQLFDEYFGPTDRRATLTEQLLVVEHLRLGAVDAAAGALAAHLEATRQRTKARLKVLAVIPDPETEPYLERIH
jgi:DNA-binding GntR family transcriptional regulator